MLTRKAAINKVERFAREIKATGLHLKRVVLFGSFAHGKTYQWSDIDVALVTDEFTTNEIKNLTHFSRINVKDAYYRISPHTYNTYNTKHFTPKVDPFVEVILEKGIEIYFTNKK